MQEARPEIEWTGGLRKKTSVEAVESGWRGRGRRRARPLPTEQPTGGDGGRQALTGCSAANPQQNASGSTAATVQQDECGLLAANP